LLVPTESSHSIELIQSGSDCQSFTLTATQSAELFFQAVQAARAAGLPWREGDIILRPMNKLVDLVQRGRSVLAQDEEEDT
jgi:hypothetical protein